MIPYLHIVVLSVFAIAFYRAGKQEGSWGILWVALSIGGSFLVLRFSNWGLIGVLAVQVLLYVCITLYRMWRQG